MMRLLILLAFAGIFTSAPLDPYLDADMSRQMLFQIPGLLALGALMAWRTTGLVSQPNAFGLLILSLGLIFFWMVPRSLDLAVAYHFWDLPMHASLLLAGFGLRYSLSRLNLIFGIAAGIYGAAMWSAYALILAQSPAQICARFTLEQQQQAGTDMLWAGGFFLILHLVTSISLLVRSERAINNPPHHPEPTG